MSSAPRNPYSEEGVESPENQAFLAELVAGGAERLEQEPVLTHIPFCEALGMRLLALGPGQALMATPYRPELIGDPQNNVIHGGVVTTLIDTAAGMAAAMNEGFKITPMATLDLRIDYMRPAEPGRVVFAKARRFRQARHIAFIRAIAFEESADDPLAMGVGAFMMGSKVIEGGDADGAPKDNASGKGERA